MRLRNPLALAMLFLGLLTVQVQGQATLKWKFEKDKTFYQTMVTTTEQSMDVMGTNVAQNQSQEFVFSWKVENVEGDKVTLKQKITAVKMKIDIGGSVIEYDSTDKEASQKSALKGFFDALLGSEFDVVLDTKAGKIDSIKNQQDFIKKLTEANPQMKGLLDQILSESALKEMAGPTFTSIPGKEVKKDETWTRNVSLDMGPIGKYDTTYTYKYAGANKEKLEEIKVATELKYQPPAGNGQKTLPFTIKSADLTANKDAGGTILFDPAKGRVKSSEMSMELTGSMKIEIGGQTTEVKLTQKQKTTSTTSDEDPNKK